MIKNKNVVTQEEIAIFCILNEFRPKYEIFKAIRKKKCTYGFVLFLN